MDDGWLKVAKAAANASCKSIPASALSLYLALEISNRSFESPSAQAQATKLEKR